MICVNKNFEIRLEEGEVFYAKRDHEPSGHAPFSSVPKLSQGVVPRILNGSFLLNGYSAPKSGGVIIFMGPDARRYVGWRLEVGEAVCFSYHGLVGFSSTISLRTDVSLRLSAFAMNKLIYPIALGPGLLLMQCAGNPLLIDEFPATATYPPSRLVCWSAETIFELEARKGLFNAFLSPVYVRPAESEKVVVEADVLNKSAQSMMGRLIRTAFPKW